MKTVYRIAAVAAFFTASGASAQQLAPSPTLDAIKARGHIECGVHLGLPGFSFANDKGELIRMCPDLDDRAAPCSQLLFQSIASAVG
jgi:ABC-type amino acid transport substrate-binding protein